MVLSYYIATKLMNISDFYSFSPFFFFFTVVFLRFLEKQMQHIPVVSHVLWRQGDSYFENDGRGPYYTNNWLIPSTGLLCLFTAGKSLHGTGE